MMIFISNTIKAAGFGLSLALILACSTGDDREVSGANYSSGSVVLSSFSSGNSSSSSAGENNQSSSSGAGISSSVGNSSSSSAAGSSSSIRLCNGFINGTEREHYEKSKPQFCDERDGKKYVYVEIGTQIWMAENLNYNAPDSKCYNNSPSNCTKYGKLYVWETAKTVCPTGWHLPTSEEWNALIAASGGSSTVGKFLKAASGWNNGDNSTDNFGFAALPGGLYSYGEFYDVNIRGIWWSGSESSSGDAYRLYIYNGDVCTAGLDYAYKDYGFSVRCLNDYGSDPSSSSANSSSSSLPSSSSSSSDGIVHGAPITYGGETYETVVIGTQTWMARNLNYNASGSKCYYDDPANCTIYGRLYDWSTAMALPSSCNSSTCSSQITNAKHRGICPSGWHIPTNAEWDALYRYADGTIGTSSPYDGYDSPTAGKYLKATSGWNSDPRGKNGLDTYGFAALPGGYFNGYFLDAGYSGSWWSTSEDTRTASEDTANKADDRDMLNGEDGAYWDYSNKTNLLSVRCLKD